MTGSHRNLLYIVALATAVVITLQIVHTVPAEAQSRVNPAPVSPPAVALASASRTPNAELIELATRDPEQLSRLARERYARQVREYSCVFLKQELLEGGLTPVQEIKVLYRDKPHSVFMTWLRNADNCRRALFIQGKHVDNGQEQAEVEPNGAIVRLFVSKVLVPIRGERSRDASRRSIDEFGFKSTLDMLERYNRIAEARGVLEMKYEGQGTIDGRPTFVLSRELPYTGPDSGYPDARMVIHFDQEWLLPVAVYSWADHNERQLLGSYVITDVKLNPGLTDADFEL